MATDNIASKGTEHQTNISMWLDFFRWFSALLVVFTHANNRFLTKILALPHQDRSVAHYAFALISGFGHQAVVVFFVLSGMFVGGGSLRAYQRTGIVDAPGYVSKRLTRLWIVLIPSFASTLIFDKIGVALFPLKDGGPFVAAEHGPVAFLCNAVFLQTTFCNQYGTDAALWSLFHEFWYYVAWLFVLIGLSLAGRVFVRILCFALPVGLLLVLANFQFIGPNIAAYSVIWLLGIVASARKRPLLDIGLLPMAAVLIGYLLSVRAAVPTDWADNTFGIWFACDTGLAILFTNLILCMKASPRMRAPPGGQIHTRLAGFAFSLYCTHSPLLNLYVAVMMVSFGIGWQMIPVGPGPWLIVLTGILLAIAFAYGFSRVTEVQTDRVRRFLETWIGNVFPAIKVADRRRVEVR